jgi:hypothetical protein
MYITKSNVFYSENIFFAKMVNYDSGPSEEDSEKNCYKNLFLRKSSIFPTAI